jgi:hypothetical protein
MDTTCELVFEEYYPNGPGLIYDSKKKQIQIPACRLRGSISQGQYSATISQNGRLRVNNTNNKAFWLEIDIPEILEIVKTYVQEPEKTDS